MRIDTPRRMDIFWMPEQSFMVTILNRLDDISGIGGENKAAVWLERIAFAFLVIMAIAAPHSIAATQAAWLAGMLAWVARFFVKPRPKLVRTPLDIALLAFFAWSVLSAFTSYAPDISIDKLRNVSLFLIFYFVINNLRTRSAAVFVALALIVSSMVMVIKSPAEHLIGRGVEIYGISADGPLGKAKLPEGITILKVNGNRVSNPDQVRDEIESHETSEVIFHQTDFYLEHQVSKADLLPGNDSTGKLGINTWKRSHSWRSMGFYGHFTTYSEVLQLVASLILGFFIALPNKRSKHGLLLAAAFALTVVAIFFSATRASEAGLLVSAFAIVFAGASRRTFLILTAVAIPTAIVGLLVIQQIRNVGFYDTKDASTTWRQTVYREGVNLATANARHMLVGVGMDSIKRYAAEWHLFDDGRLPAGHFHSTPLQIAVERGIPALLLWFGLVWAYGRSLWRSVKENQGDKWAEKGVILGALGGLAGFMTAGMVHYNLGDGEVAMVFYLLMGLSVYLAVENRAEAAPA